MHTPQQHKFGFKAWIPTIGLAFAAFVFNTSEFLPVGLLPNIAESIHESVLKNRPHHYGLRLGRIPVVASADNIDSKAGATPAAALAHCDFCPESFCGFVGRYV